MRDIFVGLLFLITLSACSNDSVLQGISQSSDHDAKIESARISLDKSDYDQVITDLTVLYNTTMPDPEVGQLLASAYMGKAWLDITFITGSTSTNDFDAIASAISSSNIITADKDGDTIIERYITGSLMPDLLINITKAKRALAVLDLNGVATNDDYIQLGIASAIHFVMYVGDKTADALGSVPVPINTAAYRYYNTPNNISNRTVAGNVNATSFHETTIKGVIPTYQDDMMNIKQAVTSFTVAYPEPSDLRDKLNGFLHMALNISSDQTITDDLIQAYTTIGINTFVQNQLAK